MKLHSVIKKCLDYILFLKSMHKTRPCMTLFYRELKYKELCQYKGTPPLQRHTCVITMKSCREHIRILKMTQNSYTQSEGPDLQRNKQELCQLQLHVDSRNHLTNIGEVFKRLNDTKLCSDQLRTQTENLANNAKTQSFFPKKPQIFSAFKKPEVMLITVKDRKQAMHFAFNQFTSKL